MTTLLRAYHGNPAIKDRALTQIRAHQQADRIIQGHYWEKGYDGVLRGCAVGCLLQDPAGGHERYETEFGIPAQLAWLEDRIFEALDPETAQGWPLRFMAAVPVGADLTTVWPRFSVWLMVDPTWGLVNVTEAEDVKEVCRRVAAGYEQILAGGISDADAEPITAAALAASAAWDAWAAWAAWAASAARAAWAAWAARAASDASAAWAARAASDASAAWDARAAYISASADQLIHILETSTEGETT